MSMFEEILYQVDDRIAQITLNRPERHNALNKRMVSEIISALSLASNDDAVRVVTVTGAGEKAFSAGYDIKESAEAPKRTLAQWRERMQKDLQFTYSAWNCEKPVIAVINGFCLAGALEFVQCCDIRYCSDDATFGVVETRFSNGIATMMMPWILGNRCRELIYTGDRFGASEAHRLGLVDRVFKKKDLSSGAIQIARRMSRVSLDCLRWNKRSINHTFETMGLRSAIQYGSEACAIMDATSSPEADEFDQIRRSKGLPEAIKWRDSLFSPYE